MANVNYAVADNWGSGFVGAMTVPAGSAGLNGWTVEFDAAFDISNIWGAEIVSHVGDHYVIRNMPWNAAVPANASASFGFQAGPGSAATSASGFTLNGVGGDPAPVLPAMSVADAAVAEGDSGTSDLAFTVSLSAPSSTPVTVSYSTANGTATAGSDFTGTTGTLTFAPGETSKVVHVAVTGDTAVEANETLSLVLSAPAGATLAHASATGTIQNNDTASGGGGTGGGGTGEGRVFSVTTDGPDIVGFDPAKDKLDLGGVSVHNFIVVDTPAGVGFMNPWSGETAIVQGVSLGQLTIDSFMPIENNHLRQDLSGALAWEQGITGEPHTVYARSHEIGQIDKVAFDPATDVVDFRYFGTREQIYMVDSAEGVVISNSGTGQALILLGVKVADLTIDNFEFHFAQVREDRVALQLGFSSVPDSQVLPQGVPIAGTDEWPSHTGTGTPPSGVQGETFTIAWNYGSDAVLDFNPASDKLDFGWFKAYEFSIAQTPAGLVITIEGNHQTYTLPGVTLSQIEMSNIIALDTTARAEWQAAIDAAPPAPVLPVLNVADASIAEGDAGTAMMMFTVTLSAPSASQVSVSYSTLNGTATAGSDYASSVGTIVFAPGETSKMIHVPVTGDTLTELNESFSLHLSAPLGATINDSSAVGTILNDDVDTNPSAPPVISIADAQVAEGDVGEAHFMFMVTLDKASTTPVTVHYATANGTATDGSDYSGDSGTLTFAPGETSQMLHVHVMGDTAVEANETFTVTLSDPTGATLGDAVATGTILNDDSAPGTPPALSIADLAVTEGNGEHSHFVFTVTLDKPATGPVSVQYATANGTASAGADYVAGTGTVTFAAGETSKTVHVDIVGDTAVEGNETFSVTLSNPSGATIADGTAIGTILDDDSAPVMLPAISIGDLSVAEGNGEHAHFMFTVTLDKPALGPVTVQYATADGTAVAGADYVAGTGTITFAAGETSKTVHVDIVGDTVVEANETFSVKLSSPSGATLAEDTAVGTILNDDVAPVVPPAVSIADATLAEGNGGTGQMSFTVTLDKAATGPVSVQYATANGTATAGSDYASKTGTVTFAAGETTKTIQIAVTGDTAVEANESFTVKLSNPTGLTIAAGTATGTIVNDDVATPPAGSSGLDYVVNDNWGAGFVASMTVEAGPSALNGWTVEFDSAFTITNIWNAEIVSHVGSHYVVRNAAWNGTVGAGKEVAFGFQATAGAGGTAATGFLVNGAPVGGDPVPVLPTLAVADASVAEGHAGTSDLAFTVSLSAASSTPVTVAYATANGTASAGSDYAALAGTLTFAPGETTKVVHVQVTGDTAVEANETLTLTLTNPTGATLADASATGTIVNDDVAPVPPVVSIADGTLTEGNAGTSDFAFTVTLDKAATGAVSVQYATANGTATAGSDYAATSGTVTFAAGETSKVVYIQVSGDTAVEANETFTVKLSAPTGATLGHATATGTIVNDDTAPPAHLPEISVSDASVVEGNPGSGGGGLDGWLSTSGNQIVDAAGNAVQIGGVNWFGFESDTMSPHGLWTRSYQDMMDQMKDLGFNTIRLPFSTDMLHATSPANGIDYAKNPDLAGLAPLQVMDKIVDYADAIGMKIILDHHRSDAGAGTSANGLWYDSTHSEAQWVSDWQMLAQRYAGDTAVIGADLHNEPYNGTWGGGGANDWATAAERAGNAIGDVNSNWLIFVEGIGTYEGNNYWWGGNLMGVRDRPIELDVDNKLVYSAHDYPNSIYPQPWFSDPSYPANLPEKFDQMWGYIYKENIAPVYIGEFGTKLTDPKDAPWLEAITSYLGGDLDNNGTTDIAAGDKGVSWTYWSWNPNSGDTGGILKDDWTSVNTNKLSYLEGIEYDFGDAGSGGAGAQAHALFTVTLSEAATGPVTLDFHTVADTAGAADFTAVSGTLTFAAGEQTKIIAVPITADRVAEADEHFSLVLSNPTGATLAHATGIGTIVNDDGATSTPPTTPTDPAPPSEPVHDTDLQALFSSVDSWGGGFNASIAIHNDGATAAHGWQLEINMPYEIENIWNAEIVSHDADGYVIRNAAWNGDIGHDGTVSFGFIGKGQLDAAHIDLLI
ncbi:Calx-beta domain-containing protein [Roseixanthobacter glucoisosaccharinicivorans]|uniref:Calx-beta domain-containing protein n=1 Tax=Roseixanthobacter glucoisosaccharinicivorans TaxID=3119923 RepID=UPI003728EB69